MSHATASTGIPTARGRLPFIGHAWPMLRTPLEFLASLQEQGGLVRIAMGPLDVVVVCDPELVHRVFLDDRTFDKGGPFNDRVREAVGDNVGTCPHHEHRRQRRLLQPAFRVGRFAGYGHAMSRQIADKVDSWHDGQVLDVPAEMTTLTTNVLTTTMFSDTLTPAQLRQSRRDAGVVSAAILPRMFMPRALHRLPIPTNVRFTRSRDRLRRTIEGVVHARRAEGGDRGDLLSVLLSASDTESTGDQRTLSDTELVDQSITFHLAGSETTAIALTWALHFVARDPDLERRLHAEVDTVLAGRTADYDDLPALELTGRVVTETLRYRSPVWLLTREVTADTELGGHPLPAGTVLAYSPHLVHHRADLYDHPERFDPDRWDPALRPAPPRTAFLPFAHGARKCIGDRFAVVEATLALASIAARWRLTHLPDEDEVRLATSAVLRPHRLRMRVTRRAPEPDRVHPTGDAGTR